MERLREIEEHCKFIEFLNKDYIAYLVDTVKQLEATQEQLLEQNKLFRQRIFELKRKTGYQVYEENLRLVHEIEKLKDDKDLFSKLFVKAQLGD